MSKVGQRQETDLEGNRKFYKARWEKAVLAMKIGTNDDTRVIVAGGGVLNICM